MRRPLAGHGLAPLLALLLISLLAMGALAGSERAPSPDPGRPDLVIAHTNDLHAHYRSFTDRRGELTGGFARLAGRIAELRAEYGERLLYLDAGDLFMGTPFYHFYRGSLGIELLEAMGCDAMALGNHELDDGSLNFQRAAVGARFPVLNLNLAYPDGTPLLPAATLLRAGGLDVEVVSVLTETMPELSTECARGELVITPPAAALRAWLGEERPHADLRLVLSHCGLAEDLAVAERVQEIPLIIGGHSHSFIEEPERVGDVTVWTVGCCGYYLGVIECYRQPDGGWEFRARREAVSADWPEEPGIRAMIEDAAGLVDREMKQVLADLPESFDGRGKSERPDPLGIFIADLMRRGADADLGLQNVGGYRSYLPAGPVDRERVFELLPFNNRVLRLHFEGRDLARLFDTLAANHGGGRFAQIAGGRYHIVDGSALDPSVGGEPLDPDRRYTLATLDFLYGGGDGYGEVLHLAAQVDTLDVYGRDLLEQRLRAGDPPLPEDFPPTFTMD